MNTETVSASAVETRQPETPAAGRLIDGRYRLTRKLGEGGMGEVWAADQTEPVARPVALKFLLGRYAPGSDAARRFVEEAQITARLQHPGVPPVHHVGELPDGRAFLVMKLIAEHTLDTLIKESGHGAAMWLGVFEGVCQAVGYAHAQHVIHRDLKPQNVMVGAFGEVQVMDWGLAKSMRSAECGTRNEDSEAQAGLSTIPHSAFRTPHSDVATRTGSLMGTPAYMAPEQATGEWGWVNERSDVFGLGAVLCALLTGLPPYTGADALSVQLRAACGDTRETFARLDGCGADPDLIALCKRCLAADPDARPADGAAVAEAVAGWRRESEERARRAEVDRAAATVRAAEHRKRWRLALTAVGLLAAVLAAGVVGTSVGLARAERAKANETAVRQKAEADRDRTRGVLDVMTTEISGDLLTDPKGFAEKQAKLQSQVLAHYREFAADEAADEPARRRAAAAGLRVGELAGALGRREEAVAGYRTACREYEKLMADHPTAAEYRRGLADAHHGLGVELFALGRFADAEEEYRRALGLRETLDDVDDQRAVGNGRHCLGVLLCETGRPADARTELVQALAIRGRLVGTSPDRSHDLALTHLALGRVCGDLGKKADAETHYRAAVPRLEELVKLAAVSPEYRRELAAALNDLGCLLTDRKEWDEADTVLRRALAYRAALADEVPNAEHRRELAATHANLGNLNVHRRKWPEAEEHFRQAVARYEKLVADGGPPAHAAELGNTYLGCGVLALLREKPRDGLRWFDKAIDTLTPLHMKGQSANVRLYLRNAHRCRATARVRLEEFAAAVPDWDAAIDLSPAGERPTLRASRADCLVRAGVITKAVTEVAELTKADGWTADQWYDFACLYAVAAAKRVEYADRAMGLLRKAVAAGYRDAPHVAADADLNSLRERADFKRLLADLNEK